MARGTDSWYYLLLSLLPYANATLIDLTIAVVVFPVAKFSVGIFGFDVTLYILPIGSTDILTLVFTQTFADHALFVQLGKIFIHGAVTVIVFSVAFFSGGKDFPFAGDIPETADTLLCTGLTFSLAFGVFGS